ncbi:MAG TPA: hypothetical protein PK177_22490 [Burkholderiaceae bacterium]|nr:hypothetical protein [Burkholderiaceae bacterium]
MFASELAIRLATAALGARSSSAIAIASVIGLASFIGIASPAWSAEVGIARYQGKRVLFLRDIAPTKENPRGESMRVADVAKLEALIARERVDEVLFDSGGGDEPAGLAIGRLIRKQGLATRIPSGARCASACADAFLGGVARRIEPNGRYGIHMPTGVNDPDLVRKLLDLLNSYKGHAEIREARKLLQFLEKNGAKMAARWAAFVVEMGASQRLVSFGVETSAAEMTYLTRQQMVDFNVVNVID